nr:DUF4238 domain-containing protein [uncultured Brevundimonas sp.]
MTKPRNHHYVPQFWQREFAGGLSRVWAYDYQKDAVEPRSPKAMMQERDLYTVDRGGAVDVSLETVELGQVDGDGAQLLKRLIAGETSADLRTDFADFLAVEALRIPEMVTRYGELSQALILQLLEAPVATDYDDFVMRIQAKGGRVLFLDEPGFNALRVVPLADIEQFVEAHIDAVVSEDGDKDIPHTDAIRDPAARKQIADRLLGMTWTVKRFARPDILLGDTGVIFEKGDMDSGWRAPLAPGLALFIDAGADPAPTTIAVDAGRDHEIDNLNYETAARSTRWLIGSSQAVVERYAPQVTG